LEDSVINNSLKNRISTTYVFQPPHSYKVLSSQRHKSLPFSALKAIKNHAKPHFSMKKHAFAAKMVDEKKQALNPYEDILHLKRPVIS
jgi:hypothetical protein